MVLAQPIIPLPAICPWACGSNSSLASPRAAVHCACAQRPRQTETFSQSNPSPKGLHQARGRVFHSHTAALQERTARTETQNEARALLQKLPVYKWLVALPQLTSRICHPNTDVKTLTHEILKKVAATFPQQACPLVLWPVCLVLWHPREESQRHALKAIG